MRFFFTLSLTLLVFASPALAHRKARTVTDEGKPITVWLAEGKKTFVSFPDNILGFDAPVSSSIMTMQVVKGFDTTLVVRVLEAIEPTMMSIPTLGGVHIVNFLPHKNGDTYVTVKLTEDTKAKVSANPYAQDGDDSPLQSGMAQLWYAMYSRDGSLGVKRDDLDVKLCDNPQERQTLIWRHHGDGLTGYTVLVENHRPSPITINHAALKPRFQRELYASSLSTIDFNSTQSIPAGGFGFIHFVYIGEEKRDSTKLVNRSDD